MAGGSNPTRAILYAFFANFGISIAKGAATFYTGSSAMLAETLHSIADTGNQVLLLLGIHRSKRPPDREHPLGYGKVTYFWSFVVAVLLFSVGGLFSLYEGFHKLSHPGQLEGIWVAVLVLLISIGLESLSLRGCLREVRLEQRDRSLWRWLMQSRSAELIVVLGEDLAALLGLVLALVFLLIAGYTGDGRFDAMGSMTIGVLLIVVAVFVATRVKAMLIGRSADPDVIAVIEAEIAGHPAIREVFNVLTVQVGTQVMVAAKLRMRADLSITEACGHLNRLERQIEEAVPEISWCFMEPDVED